MFYLPPVSPFLSSSLLHSSLPPFLPPFLPQFLPTPLFFKKALKNTCVYLFSGYVSICICHDAPLEVRGQFSKFQASVLSFSSMGIRDQTDSLLAGTFTFWVILPVFYFQFWQRLTLEPELSLNSGCSAWLKVWPTLPGCGHFLWRASNNYSVRLHCFCYKHSTMPLCSIVPLCHMQGKWTVVAMFQKNYS